MAPGHRADQQREVRVALERRVDRHVAHQRDQAEQPRGPVHEKEHRRGDGAEREAEGER